MMEKIIRVNGINVKERLCTVDFIIISDIDGNSGVSITHGKLYQLLDSATEVKETKDFDMTKGNYCFAEFKQGIIWFKAYVKEHATQIH